MNIHTQPSPYSDPREPGRNDLDEARQILAGTSLLLPETRHLEALAEHHECVLIQLANKVMGLHTDVLNSD